jgi:hypothetical protein
MQPCFIFLKRRFVTLKRRFSVTKRRFRKLRWRFILARQENKKRRKHFIALSLKNSAKLN